MPKLSTADNPNTHPSVLERLAQESDERVLRNVARNLNTPIETLKTLAKSKIEVVKEYAIKTLAILESKWKIFWVLVWYG